MMSLTLAMLVKDPPLGRLGYLFAHVADVVDQTVIVLDSRSATSDHAALADMGAEVIPFDWCDDFALARNAALAHAEGDWILHLDPDEWPTERMLAFIEMVTASAWLDVSWQGQTHYAPRGYLFWTTNGAGDSDPAIEHDWHCRLFRRTAGRWYKPVHELVALDGRPEAETRETPLLVKAPRSASLRHEGHTDPAKVALYAALEGRA